MSGIISTLISTEGPIILGTTTSIILLCAVIWDACTCIIIANGTSDRPFKVCQRLKGKFTSNIDSKW